MPSYAELASEPPPGGTAWVSQVTPAKHNGPWAKPLADRIKANVLIDSNGCWRWQLYVRSNGYGQIGVPQVGIRYVHRIAYEVWKGPIPGGLQVDHLCRVRDCCNPDHLEAVTCRENLVRGTGFVPNHLAKTHCAAGHPYDEKNTYIRPLRNGRTSRDCRRCKVAAGKRYRIRRRSGGHHGDES